MRIEFTYTRSADYFRAQLRPGAWRRIRPKLALATVLTAGGATAATVFGDSSRGALGAVAVIVALLLVLAARRRYVSAVTVPASWRTPRTWTITDEALESSTDLTSSRWAWSVVRGVEQGREAYLFRQDGPVVFDVPREPLTAEQDAALRTHLAHRGLIPPSPGAAR